MKTTRRDFLKAGLLATAGLLIGFEGNRRLLGEAAAAPGARLSKWIRIDPSGTVTLTIQDAEMGQGVRTSQAMLLAEELEADWSKVAVVQAAPGAPDFPSLGSTGGSDSMEDGWEPMRKAGAAAREMLLAAAAAKWSVPAAECHAEKGFVVHAASGRRLAFGELAEAAAKLELPKEPKLKDKKDYRIIGQPLKRINGRDMVTGRAIYGLDTRVPGLQFASIERPPWRGAKAVKWNEKAALAVGGVKSVVPAAGGVAVVAANNWAALKGRKALAVEWSGGERAFDSRAHATALAKAAGEPGHSLRREAAPPETAAATRILEATYTYPFYAHAPLETMNCIAEVTAERCRVWAPTQASGRLRKRVADFLKIPPEQVEVQVTLMGGGFGRRLAVDYAIEAAEVSRAVQAPVQVVWTRADDMKFGHFQAASSHRLKGGFDAQGRLVSWQHTKAGSFHNLDGPPTAEQAKAEHFHAFAAWGVYDVPYVIPGIETAYVPVELPVKHGPWRAVFAPSSVFARECFFDELAAAAKADPLDYRLEKLTGGTEVIKLGPTTVDRRRLRAVLELAKEKSSWALPLAAGRARGVACNAYFGGTCLAYVVEVLVGQDGTVKVERVIAAVDCGLVVNPTGVEQQIEGAVVWGLSSALHGAITFAGGQAQQSSFADFGVVRMKDAPKVEVHFLPNPGDKPRGMGEPPVPPIVPALVNALFAATGKRVRHLPVRPEDLRV